MPTRTFLLAAVLIPVLADHASASKVKVWHHAAPGQFDKAQLRGTVATSEGSLRLSRQLKLLADLDASHVWSVVEDFHGNLLVATGDDGRLYRIGSDGKVTLVFVGDDSQILCLVVAPDGCIYAGTGPNGRIIRVTPDGTASVFYQSPESYIWSLATDDTGEVLFAGTGPHGLIYQVNRQGQGKVFYATKQEHILCLALAEHGALYAGTDKSGLVYRFDSKGKGFVLFHAPQSEVHTLLATSGGVFAGTSSPRRRGIIGSSSIDHASSPDLAAILSSAPGKTPGKSSSDGPARAGSSISPLTLNERDEHSLPGTLSGAPGSGENSVYRIGDNGSVREIFRERALILSLCRQNGHIFVGTGMEGQLFEVDELTKERSEIARLDHGQVHAFCRRSDGSVVVGTGDPGKLYVLQDKLVAHGTMLSDVLDAKLISRWGALRWHAETPEGTQVSVAVRSGNLAEPDDTWSEWSAEQTNPENAIANAPPARFLQYRVTLRSTNVSHTPAFRGLTIRYATLNLSPEVTGIDVPDLEATAIESSKKIHIKWSASDPNEDELTYNLYVRKQGWPGWVLLEEDLEKKEYEWDATAAPAGIYQVRVLASDRKDNSDEDALTGERISVPFAVAHEPPSVTLRVNAVEGGRALVEANATDTLVRLTSASYAVNGKQWINVYPKDGLFDSHKASFQFRTENHKPGNYVIVLRVRDAAGNVGAADAVFTVPGDGVSNASGR
jgi:WD40 repeat protein